MAMVRCANCSAPLTPAENATFVQCPFCHATTKVGAAKAVKEKVPNAGPPRAALIFAVFGAVSVLFVAGIVFAVASRPKAPPVVVNIPSMDGLKELKELKGLKELKKLEKLNKHHSGAKRFKPSELAAAVESEFGWLEVDAPGFIESFENFDVLANEKWALTIAQNWSADAQLESLYLDGLKPDGQLDLSARERFYADYRFTSKKLVEAQEKLREVSDKKLKTSFRVKVEKGEVRVLGSEDSSPPKFPLPAPAFTCPLKTAVEVAQQKQKLAPRPHYSGMARPGPRGWAWSLSADGAGSARQTTADCKPW